MSVRNILRTESKKKKRLFQPLPSGYLFGCRGGIGRVLFALLSALVMALLGAFLSTFMARRGLGLVVAGCGLSTGAAACLSNCQSAAENQRAYDRE
jgi:hypothetical protein